MSIDSNLAFGSRLRAHRERRGLTLTALADTLKTKQSLLDELERDDVTRWPPGIYGRALVREYAKLVGLPPDEIVQQFVQLFAAAEEPQKHTRPARAGQDDTPAELRLIFAAAPARRSEALYGHLFAAAVELIAVLTAAYAVTAFSGLAGWTATAIIALTWYPARAALWGHDTFYRILRLQRLTTSFLWSHTTELPPIASLMSIGRAAGEEGQDSADDPFIVETDVNGATSSSATLH
jgi:transcriptional regulator with XRE-family HTH domain